MEGELAELRRVNANLRRELAARAGRTPREADRRREGEGERRNVDGEPRREGDRKRDGDGERTREGEGERRREGDRRRDVDGERKREGEGDRRREGDGERKRDGEGPRERAAAGLPSGIQGFKGILEGSVVRKGERGFILKISSVKKTWPHNRARNPRTAVGKEIEILIQADRAVSDRWIQLTKEHFKVLSSLKPGDRVRVEAFHFSGGHLTVVEGLGKIS